MTEHTFYGITTWLPLKTWERGSGTSFMLPGDNEYKIQLKQRDLAGNESLIYSSDDIITIDNTAPAQVLTFALDQDTGISNNDNITQSRWLRINNISELNGELPWEYSLDNGSTWSSGDKDTILLEKNTVFQAGSIQLRHYDMAGNPSRPFKNSDKITIDNDAPNPPNFILFKDTGPFSDDYITQNAYIYALLDQGAGLEYQIKNADNNSEWVNNGSAIFNLEQNQTYKKGDIKVRQIDVAGNISDPNTNKVTFVIDNEKPSAPSFTLAHDTGVNDSDNITQNNQVNVAVETNAIWYYRVSKLFDSVGLWSDGSWKVGSGTSFKFQSDNGKYKIQLKQMDLAGNESDPDPISDETIITIDNKAPARLLTFALEKDTGISDNDNITQIGRLRVNNISALNGELPWEYSLDNGITWSSDDEDTILLKKNAVYQAGSIQVRHYDMAGNPSRPFKNSDKITIDNEAPSEKLSFALRENTGIRNSDTLIRTRNPLVVVDTQLLEEKASWQYSLDGGEIWEDGANGQFALDDDGVYATGSIQVRQVDFAGNLGPIYSNSQAIEIDHLAPTFTSNNVVISFDNNALSSTTVVYLANAKDQNNVRYTLGGNNAPLFNIDASNGNVSINNTSQNTYRFIVTAEDEAGNTASQDVTLYINSEPEWQHIGYGSVDRTIGRKDAIYSCQKGWNNGVQLPCSEPKPQSSAIGPRDGGWGPWQASGSCSTSCGGGTQTLTRYCNKPSPANGGKTCVGSKIVMQACNTQACPCRTLPFGDEKGMARNGYFSHNGEHFSVIDGIKVVHKYQSKENDIIPRKTRNYELNYKVGNEIEQYTTNGPYKWLKVHEIIECTKRIPIIAK